MIDLAVRGDSASCRQAGADARVAARGLSRCMTGLSTVKSSAAAAWTGGAADAFAAELSTVRSAAQALERRVSDVASAVHAFADDLTAVRDLVTEARETAVVAGLVVAGESVSPPADLRDDATASQARAYAVQVAAYEKAAAIVGYARTREAEAHERLDAALLSATRDGWLEELLERVALAPPDGRGVAGHTMWGLRLAATGFGAVASWMVHARYGVFQPRVGGAFVSPSAMTALQRGAASMAERNWHATPYRAATRESWRTASTWAARVGPVLSFGNAAGRQWSDDADDPGLSTSERVGRAGTVGGTTALGSSLGAWGGAQVGGAIGTVICPGAGTVVGGVLGGLVGGVAGSELGAVVGDWVKDEAGRFAESVSGGIGAAAERVGDALMPHGGPGAMSVAAGRGW